MTSVTLSSGECFHSPSGRTILEAALSAGVPVPYSCRVGRCGACRCKVIRGVTRALDAETALSEDERSEGWVLACVRAVESQAWIDMHRLPDIELPLARTWPCRISDLQPLAPDVLRVLLRLPPATTFHYLPGQHLQVIGPGGLRRSYSPARASAQDHLLELHVRAVPGGAMSDYWFRQARVNDLLRLYGPLGSFFLRETAGLNLIFMATGTGIAPIRAMLADLEARAPEDQPKSVTVLWGGRRLEDLYLDTNEWTGAFTYTPVLSRPDATWRGARGYLQDVLLAGSPELSRAEVYACGSEAMIRDARAALQRAGLAPTCFHADAFVDSEAR